MADVRINQRKSQSRCVFCHDSDELLSECHRCHARIHLECFISNGDRCPTIGCVEAETPGNHSTKSETEWIQNTEIEYSLYENFWIGIIVTVVIIVCLFAISLVVG